jgi:ankyrin repeat protein
MECVSALLQFGADVRTAQNANQDTCLMWAAMNGIVRSDQNKALRLTSDNHSCEWALSAGHTALVSRLLELKVPLDAKNKTHTTALMCAVNSQSALSVV